MSVLSRISLGLFVALAIVSRTPKAVLLQHSAKTPVSRHG